MNATFRHIFCVLASMLCAQIAFAQASPAGLWRTIDDKTGNTKSLVRIKDLGGVFSGSVEKILDPSVSQQAKCEECKDARKDKPILGMTILTGMRANDDGEWSGGQILDPKSGSVYKCKMKLLEGGKKLEVRGFIGFSLIGRSQTWVRAE